VQLTSALALGAFAIAVGTTVAASVYPAQKASRLPIVDALRHNH
jgi:putative ABC transport system permease protein